MAQPTIIDVARAAGVSKSLVSLVMADSPKVSSARRKLVLEAAADLGYRPNDLAKNLKLRRTTTLGVVVSNIHIQFALEAIDGMQACADEAGYNLLLANGGHSKTGEASAIDTFLRFRVDGLIYHGSRLPVEDIEELTCPTPVVMLTRLVERDSVDCVTSNDYRGAQLAVEHLAGLGHTRIAHIDGGEANLNGSQPRRLGYLETMTKLGLGDSALVVEGDFSEEGGFAGADILLDSNDPPTAIFAANDLSAIGVLNRLEERGVRVPEDISVVGYDNTAMAATRHVSLTTLDQPAFDMGRTAVELLLERLDQDRSVPAHHISEPTLVARATTGPPSH